MMEQNFFEKCYKLINSYNRKTAKPKNYGTDDLLYPAEVHILDTIGNQNTITVTALSEKLGITKGAVSQTTAKLIKKQLIEKTPSETEKNTVYISLSEKGQIVYDYHKKMHLEAKNRIDKAMERLSPEGMSAFNEILGILDEMLEKM